MKITKRQLRRIIKEVLQQNQDVIFQHWAHTMVGSQILLDYGYGIEDFYDWAEASGAITVDDRQERSDIIWTHLMNTDFPHGGSEADRVQRGVEVMVDIIRKYRQ